MSDLVERLKAEKQAREQERQRQREEFERKSEQHQRDFEAYWHQAHRLTREFHGATGTESLLRGVQDAFFPQWQLVETVFAGRVGIGSGHGYTLLQYCEGEGNDLEPLVPADFQGLVGFFIGLVSEFLPRNYPQPSYILTHYAALLVRRPYDDMDELPPDRQIAGEVRRYVGIGEGDCIGYLEFLFGEMTAPLEQQIPRLGARLHDPALIEAAHRKAERVVEDALRASWSRV